MGNWTKRYLDQTEFIAKSYSKDPSTKVGALIVSKYNAVLSQGWNGFARGVDDSAERYNNREVKYKLVCHAEINAICNSARNGIPLNDSSIYLYPLPPCSACATAIIQAGIKNVYVRASGDSMERWKDSIEYTKLQFEEAGINMEIEVND
jgi:dCMP deaminase